MSTLDEQAAAEVDIDRVRRAAAASVASARVGAAGVLSDELQRMRETAVACGGSIESVRAFEHAIAAVGVA